METIKILYILANEAISNFVNNLVRLSVNAYNAERVIKMPKKETNIFKRKDGRWEARYVKTICVDGKRSMDPYTQNLSMR